MLDDPFVLNDKDRLPFSLPPSSAPSSTTSITAPFALLAPHLPPARPLLHRSHSSKENATTGTRRVYFSPTPLASLKASPKHKRPFAAFLGGEGSSGAAVDGSVKRLRRNVYSANPLFEALRQAEENDLASPPGSDASTASASSSNEGSSRGVSSPPTSSSPSGGAAPHLLPPLRASAMRVSSACKPSPPRPLAFSPPADVFPSSSTPLHPLRQSARPSPAATAASDLVMPFSLPGLTPVILSPVQPVASTSSALEDDDATDSETESEAVSSLLLPSSSAHSPAKPAAVVTFFPSSFPSAASSSSSGSSSLASSSPLPSPSRNRTRRPSTTTGLRSILKTRPPGAPGVGLTARNEREGSRKNGRGRRHVVGWEDCKKVGQQQHGGQGEQQDAAAGGEGGKGKASGGAVPVASSSAAPPAAGLTGSTRRSAAAAEKRGGGGDDDPNDQQRRGQDTQSNVTSSNSGGRITHALQPDDPVHLRTPLLTLKASLRPVSDAYVRPAAPVSPGRGGEGAAPLLPRSGDALLKEEEQEDGGDLPLPVFETPTFLPDVEESYVLLTQALYRLPASLTLGAEDLARTLAPLVEMRAAWVAAVRREVGNVVSFPRWVEEQPVADQEEAEEVGGVGSSPVSRKADKGKGKEKEKSSPSGKGKKSLTEAQMRRMRDELGAAQAAVKCVAAVVKDERVWRVFEEDDLSSLLELICSVPLAPSLSPLVQKDLFPFIPFLLSNLTLPTSLLSPLLSPSLLPSLRATLTLPPRIDRFRLSVSESLAALSSLIAAHPRAMFADGAWRVWFRCAMAGLWEGSKKGVGTREKAVKVAGRVVRALTAQVGEVVREGEERDEQAWVEEREKLQKEVGREMLSLLHDSPEDAPVDPVTTKPITYLAMLLGSMTASPPSPNLNAATEEANALQHLTLLTLLPALLGPSFRKIHERGIAPWFTPFNSLVRIQSMHVLSLSALTWSHLVYAFLRTTSDQGVEAWLFRKPDARPFDLLGSLFRNRCQTAWRRADASDPAGKIASRKESQRVHAKALTLAFCATVYGLTVYIRHGTSAVRPAEAAEGDLNAPLSVKQLAYYDLVFTKLLSAFLPKITHTTVSQETPTIGWQLLSSVLRPRTANDARATLEALVNPAFLNGSLSQGIAPRAPERQMLLTAAALSGAVQPGRVPAWGVEWVEKNVEKVLELFEQCLPAAEEETLEQVVQPHYTVAWQNLLRTLSAASTSAALDKALSWLSALSGSSAVSMALWAATVARSEESIVRTVDAVLGKEVDVLEKATAAWSTLPERPKAYAEVFARQWTAVFDHSTVALSPSQVEVAVALLRYHADSPDLSTTAIEDWAALAQAINVAAWKDEPSSQLLAAHLTSLVTPPSDPSSDLRLCALLVAASHDLDLEAQESVLALSNHAVSKLLDGEGITDENVALIANVVKAASDRAFPVLYSVVLRRLQSVVNPTSADLLRFNPLLAPSLQRTNDLFFNASPEAQAQSQASLQMSLVSHGYAGQPAHRPYLAFHQFWQSTFAQAEELEYPADLQEALAVLREVSTDLRLPGFVESQPESLEKKGGSNGTEPVAGQVPPSKPTTLPTTATTAHDVSSRSYDADQSGLPRESLDESSPEESLDSREAGANGGGPPSPSLYGILCGDIPSPEKQKEPGMTQDVAETPVEVEKERARASLASIAASSSAAAQDEEVEAEEEKPVAEVDRKGKRSRDAEEITIEDSEDEEIVVAASQAKKRAPPPRKKTRASTSAKLRRSSSASEHSPAPEPSAPAKRAKPVSRKRSHTTVEVEIEVPVPAKKKRKSPSTRSKGKKAEATPSPPVEEPSASSPVDSRSSTSGSPPNSQDIEAARRFFALPLDAAFRIGKQIGGSPSLKRFMDLGERAKEYFERPSRP
ncbi:hypothetical protein JCM6882_004223 [Rhodosporidiobolus microsporus]